jgi:DNA topoisomerase-1
VQRRKPRQTSSTSDASAKEAGLSYVTGEEPGIRRRRSGKGFRYITPRGKALTSEADLRRIKSLAIPPAWSEVWICPRPDGHAQATGRDARMRKQHRYHPVWRATRDSAKYSRLLHFAKSLPRLRQRVSADLRAHGLPRKKVLGTVVKILETGVMRVGNDEYARQNNSYGLTTLKDKHVQIRAAKVTFCFRGKSGKEHHVNMIDKRLARIIKRCQDLPGQELFQYVDSKARVRDVTSTDVNHYLREITGQDFTAKDFRTWAGTVLAAVALKDCGKPETKTAAKRNVLKAIETVAHQLGNTPAICRKCYIHPGIIEAYLEQTTIRFKAASTSTPPAASLASEERAVLKLLQARLKQQRTTLTREEDLLGQLGASLRKKR